MTIHLSPGPSDGREAVRHALAHLLPQLVGGSRSPLGGGNEAASTSQPLPVFSVKLDEIDDETFTKKANAAGWRYIVKSGAPIGVADVKVSRSGAVAFKSLTRGPTAERLQMAADYADATYGRGVERFDVRILEVPALYSNVLWLHGPRDVFIPYLEGGRADVEAPRVDDTYRRRILRAAQAKRSAPEPESLTFP